MVKNDVKDYVEKLTNIENEIKLLREDKKDLDKEFKEKIDLKSVKSALRIIKIRQDGNEDLIERVLEILNKQNDV